MGPLAPEKLQMLLQGCCCVSNSPAGPKREPCAGHCPMAMAMAMAAGGTVPRPLPRLPLKMGPPWGHCPMEEERRKAGKPTSTVEATVYGCIDWPLYKARGKGGEWSRSPGHTPPVQMCAPAWGRVHAGEGWTQSPVSANTGLSNITSFLLLLFVFSSLSP